MRTPGACGGVKWGQTSLSFRLGIKGILRTAAEQLLGLPFLGRSRSVGKKSFSRWQRWRVPLAHRKRRPAPLKVQTRDKEKLSLFYASYRIHASCTIPKAKTKPNTSGNMHRLCICNIPPSHPRQQNCFSKFVTTNVFLANRPKATRDYDGFPWLAPESSRPGRVCSLSGWKTFAGQHCAGAARGG